MSTLNWHSLPYLVDPTIIMPNTMHHSNNNNYDLAKIFVCKLSLANAHKKSIASITFFSMNIDVARHYKWSFDVIVIDVIKELATMS